MLHNSFLKLLSVPYHRYSTPKSLIILIWVDSSICWWHKKFIKCLYFYFESYLPLVGQAIIQIIPVSWMCVTWIILLWGHSSHVHDGWRSFASKESYYTNFRRSTEAEDSWSISTVTVIDYMWKLHIFQITFISFTQPY